MVLSLTMLSVPSPTECVSLRLSRLSCSLRNLCPLTNFFFFFVFRRLEAYFHTCDELLHMWAHAEDLDTLEFALMQVTAYIAGPVRIPTTFVVLIL
jgi:hypothetical protein